MLDACTVCTEPALAERPSLPVAMTATNVAALPEVLLGQQPADQRPLDLATEGTQRYVWQSAFGPMLIEVRDGVAFVNGDRVASIRELQATRNGARPTGREGP